MESVKVNALIVGGGVAGLWTLDALRRAGFSAILVESNRLGSGQTIASQGILHSGLKYSLSGMLTGAAREAREMPLHWRNCLAGTSEPDLSQVRVSSEGFHLWGTDATSSRLGLWGAKLGLQVTPRQLDRFSYPTALKNSSGTVYHVDEQVIEPASLIAALADRSSDWVIQLNSATELEFNRVAPAKIQSVTLHAARSGRTVSISPDFVLLTAGKGNDAIRARLSLPARAMQLRPLHYVLVRGDLPVFHGHCIDLHQTRVSITSARDSQGRVVWQIGGQISEVGVKMDAESLIAHTRSELEAVMPRVSFERTEWTTCRVDRAEGATKGGARPDSYRIVEEGNILTAWPTKLVLAPLLARDVVQTLEMRNCQQNVLSADTFHDWPHPQIARPAWEEIRHWQPFVIAAPGRRAA